MESGFFGHQKNILKKFDKYMGEIRYYSRVDISTITVSKKCANSV